jgi:hypothetical protein
MNATGVKHWSARSGGKVISGLLIGAGILLMVLATFLHTSTVGFLIGLVLLTMGITGTLKAFLADKADKQRLKR